MGSNPPVPSSGIIQRPTVRANYDSPFTTLAAGRISRSASPDGLASRPHRKKYPKSNPSEKTCNRQDCRQATGLNEECKDYRHQDSYRDGPYGFIHGSLSSEKP
jgi:hypothetical protein